MLECLFDEELPRLEDLDWALRFSKEHQFDVIQKILAVVNQGKRPRASAVENANLRIIEKHSRSFLEEGWFFGKQCIGKRYLEIATHYFREGKKNKGFHYLIKALSENPFQRPGMYLRIIDFLIGTSFIKNLKKIRQNLVGKHKHFE